MLRFGRFELLPAQRRLLRDGAPLLIGSRAYDLLLVLADRADRTVSKTELLDLVWPDTVVEENNLHVQIGNLRKLLGARRILTIPGRGYRLTATSLDGVGAVPDSGATASRVAHPTAFPLHDGLPVLYGRTQEAADLRMLLGTHRLVTLVGAGGIGKTCVAHEVAVSLRDAHVNGVGFVELASLDDASRLPHAVADALGMSLPVDGDTVLALVHALRACHLLLVLDNCEHVVAAAAQLATALLAHTAHVTLLATSQEPLHIAQEQVFRLQPLRVPTRLQAADARAPADAESGQDGYGAVTLFAVRAREADLRFQLTAANMAAVVDICRRLDGMALAIELAAARVPLLGVRGVLDRLDDRFRVLNAGVRMGPPRQQTLHAALEWSHALLSADEQRVFRRLGRLDGAFTLGQAQAVAAEAGGMDAWVVLDHLATLVDKSMVVAEVGRRTSYRLLETNRAYAVERLLDAGEMG